MDKNQGFFDPYNFNIPQNNMAHMQANPAQMPDMAIAMDNSLNPSMYYEQQYLYYRYLTQVLEYRIKLKEWEKLNATNTTNK